MRDERFDLLDNAQLNFEDITGFSGRIIFKIRWSYHRFVTPTIHLAAEMIVPFNPQAVGGSACDVLLAVLFVGQNGELPRKVHCQAIQVRQHCRGIYGALIQLRSDKGKTSCGNLELDEPRSRCQRFW